MTEQREIPPWAAEGRWPTPEQWVDWFLTRPREEQVAMAEQAIVNGQAASSCFMQNHVGRLEAFEARLRDQGYPG